MSLTIRPVKRADFGQMAALLNQIIVAGGTTLHQSLVTENDLRQWREKHTTLNAWYVAENAAAQIVGFQYIEPHDHLPRDAADIATFVRTGSIKSGIGSLLFDKIQTSGRRLKLTWINATISAANTGGLAFYASLGFQTYRTQENFALPDGTIVSKISKRFDL